MSSEHRRTACQQLLAVLDTMPDADQQTAVIAAHLATSPDCATIQVALAALIDRYRASAPGPLAPDHEARLLHYLCGRE